jgi:hypothetical protein
LIVNLATAGPFPVESLKDVDAALVGAGFRKEVRSVVKPGREFAVTYNGPNMEKSQVEEILKPVTSKNQISFSLDVEESVTFP